MKSARYVAYHLNLLRNLFGPWRRVTGLTDGSGDLSYDVMQTWREMEGRNERLEKQTKVGESHSMNRPVH